jgi:lipopolysaccharide export system protein LptC
MKWAVILICSLISPAWGSVTVNYHAQETVIWELKNGDPALKMVSPHTKYNDLTAQIHFESPSGIVFETPEKKIHFRANTGTYRPKQRTLSLQKNIWVQTYDQGIFTSQKANILQNPNRMEFLEKVTFQQMETSHLQTPTELFFQSDKAMVYPQKSEAHFYGNCRTQFIQDQSFVVKSGSASLWKSDKKAEFSTNVTLTHPQLKGASNHLQVQFKKGEGSGQNIILKKLVFSKTPKLEFENQEAQRYTILGKLIDVNLSDSQAIDHIQAQQSVQVTLPEGKGFSQKFDYDLPAKLLIFLGQPAKLIQKEEMFTGHHIKYFSDTEIIEVARADILYKEEQVNE